MAVEVEEIEKDALYVVNGKNVYKDSNNNWVTVEELTPAEAKSFRLYRWAHEKGLS